MASRSRPCTKTADISLTEGPNAKRRGGSQNDAIITHISAMTSNSRLCFDDLRLVGALKLEWSGCRISLAKQG